MHAQRARRGLRLALTLFLRRFAAAPPPLLLPSFNGPNPLSNHRALSSSTDVRIPPCTQSRRTFPESFHKQITETKKCFARKSNECTILCTSLSILYAEHSPAVRFQDKIMANNESKRPYRGDRTSQKGGFYLGSHLPPPATCILYNRVHAKIAKKKTWEENLVEKQRKQQEQRLLLHNTLLHTYVRDTRYHPPWTDFYM